MSLPEHMFRKCSSSNQRIFRIHCSSQLRNRSKRNCCIIINIRGPISSYDPWILQLSAKSRNTQVVFKVDLACFWAYLQGCSLPDTEIPFAFGSRQLHDPQRWGSGVVLLGCFRRPSYSAWWTPETNEPPFNTTQYDSPYLGIDNYILNVLAVRSRHLASVWLPQPHLQHPAVISWMVVVASTTHKE
jgi:hypothetical protein